MESCGRCWRGRIVHIHYRYKSAFASLYSVDGGGQCHEAFINDNCKERPWYVNIAGGWIAKLL